MRSYSSFGIGGNPSSASSIVFSRGVRSSRGRVLTEKDVIIPVTCNSGTVENGEECDDGNNRDFDGCSSDCLIETGSCGDGIVQKLLGEQCETALLSPSLPYSCNGHCRFYSFFCGNGTLEDGEDCDDGAQNSNQPDESCRTDCSEARCGDAIMDPLIEECDDGNNVGNDGCSRSCLIERSASTVQGQIFDLPLPLQQTPSGTILPALTASTLPPQNTSSGPASIAIMAAGAASGIALIRRKRRKD